MKPVLSWMRLPVVLLILILLLLWSGYYYWLGWLFPEICLNSTDKFIALTTVFSGLAFTVALIALVQQRKAVSMTVAISALSDLNSRYSSSEMSCAISSVQNWATDRIQEADSSNSDHDISGESVSFDSDFESDDLREFYNGLEVDNANEIRRRASVLFREHIWERQWTEGRYHAWRLISDFFRYLALLQKNGFLGSSLVYQYWNKSDLEIIPRILIPIAVYEKWNQSRQTIRRGMPEWDLIQLYKNAPLVS